jgi:hypothetical protein
MTLVAKSEGYSLGFTRMMNLSMKKRMNCFTKLYMEGFKEIPSNDAEFMARLEKMSEVEYKKFKANA